MNIFEVRIRSTVYTSTVEVQNTWYNLVELQLCNYWTQCIYCRLSLQSIYNFTWNLLDASKGSNPCSFGSVLVKAKRAFRNLNTIMKVGLSQWLLYFVQSTINSVLYLRSHSRTGLYVSESFRSFTRLLWYFIRAYMKRR